MNLTLEQQTVVNDTSQVLVVNAYAGTGKTTALEYKATNSIKGEKGLFITFSKIVSKELAEKFSDSWECSTTHAHAFAQIKKHHILGSSIKANPNKYLNIVGTNLIEAINESFKIQGNIDYEYISRLYGKSASNSIKSRINEYKGSSMSFEDMLVLPTQDTSILKSMDTYDIIIVDEFQDITPIQLNYILSLITKKLVFLGDVYQNIYDFMGTYKDPISFIKKYADTNKLSFKKLKLTATFRFGGRIVNLINNTFALKDKLTSNKRNGIVERVSYLVTKKTLPILAKPRSEHFITRHLAPDYSKYNNVGILFKTNSELLHFKEMLESFGLYGFKAKGVVFKGVRIPNKNLKNNLSKLHLSTIHGTKGLEFDCVYIIGNNNILKRMSETQNHNLGYVAYSRAKEKLVLIN